MPVKNRIAATIVFPVKKREAFFRGQIRYFLHYFLILKIYYDYFSNPVN